MREVRRRRGVGEGFVTLTLTTTVAISVASTIFTTSRVGDTSSLRNGGVNIRLKAANSTSTARIGSTAMRECGGNGSTIVTLGRNGVSYMIVSDRPTGGFIRGGSSLRVIRSVFSGRRCTVYLSGSGTSLAGRFGRTLGRLGSSKALSSVESGCVNSSTNGAPCRAPGSTSRSGKALAVTAGTAFRPCRCCSKSGVMNVSISVTRTIYSGLKCRLGIRSVRFSTVMGSIGSKGTSFNTTKVAMARSHGGDISFASPCAATRRIIVMGGWFYARGSRSSRQVD